MDFYRRACADMQSDIAAPLEHTRGLEDRLRELIRVKLAHFAPNGGVLRALLRNGAGPKHPLSPFGAETKEIRDIDIAWFSRILVDCGIRIPRDLEPQLPGVLWFFQMGVIFFWVIDESPAQARTGRLLELAAKERSHAHPAIGIAPHAPPAENRAAVDRHSQRRLASPVERNLCRPCRLRVGQALGLRRPRMPPAAIAAQTPHKPRESSPALPP